MASAAERRRLGAILIALALLAACGSDPPPPTTIRAPTSSPAAHQPSVSPSPSPSRFASPEATRAEHLPPGILIPDAGRTFDAATILDAMRTSRRPGGVPDRLETDVIAAAVADSIWTYGGEPWTMMAIGGSCGPDECTLETAGTRPGGLGEDLWVLEIVPSVGTVTVKSANLSAIPIETVDALDELARALVGQERMDGLALTSARWLPPPMGGQFVMSYRSGGEEGSCGADITIDARAPAIVSDLSLAC